MELVPSFLSTLSFVFIFHKTFLIQVCNKVLKLVHLNLSDFQHDFKE